MNSENINTILDLGGNCWGKGILTLIYQTCQYFDCRLLHYMLYAEINSLYH